MESGTAVEAARVRAEWLAWLKRVLARDQELALRYATFARTDRRRLLCLMTELLLCEERLEKERYKHYHSAQGGEATSILALDLGQVVGWALRSEAGALRAGELDLSPEAVREGSTPWNDFEDWLLARAAGPNILALVYEQPWASPGQRYYDLEMNVGLAVVTKMVASRYRVPLCMVHPSTWHRAILGSGRLASAETKRLARAKAQAVLGRDVGPHASDALCLLLYAVQIAGLS